MSDDRLRSDTAPGEAAVAAATVAGYEHGWDGPARRKPLGFLFWLSVAWVTVIALAAILANVLPLQSPTSIDYNAIGVGPGIHHLLGTDENGRDLLSRLVFGSRVSLVVGFGSIAIGMLLGGPAGLYAGYRGGRIDTSLNALAFVILAFPQIVAVIAIISFWGATLWKITLIIGIGSAPLLFRVIRAATLNFSNRDFVLASRTLGASSSRTLLREVLPNVLPAALSFALIGVALAIVLEGSLAYLGLSVALPTPSWGNLIAQGSSNNLLQTDVYVMLWPALAMFLLLLSINFIGDRVRQLFDVREGLV